MTTTPVSLGQFVASLKATRAQLSDREAFVARSQSKYDAPSVAGLPMVGLGGSCGKPAFLLPNVVRFDLEKVERLEAVAERYPPREAIDLVSLADMLSTVVEGGIVMAKALDQPVQGLDEAATAYTALSGAIRNAAEATGTTFVGLDEAFATTDTTPTEINGRTVPENAARICTLTNICTVGDIHLTDEGAATVARVLAEAAQDAGVSASR